MGHEVLMERRTGTFFLSRQILLGRKYPVGKNNPVTSLNDGSFFSVNRA